MPGLDHIDSDINSYAKKLCNLLYFRKEIDYGDYLLVYQSLDYDEEERNEAYMYLLKELLNKDLDNLFLYSYDDFMKAKPKLYKNMNHVGASYLDVIQRELHSKKMMNT